MVSHSKPLGQLQVGVLESAGASQRQVQYTFSWFSMESSGRPAISYTMHTRVRH